MKPLVVLVMGVAGAGKTTLATTLATALGWESADADAYHPPANLSKMRAGLPLDDTDRAPWLAGLRALIDTRLADRRPLVLACSALRRAYRETLGLERPECRVVFLDPPRAVLARRLATRADHFMSPTLLDSQLATLERPEHALRLPDADTPPTLLAARVRAALGL